MRRAGANRRKPPWPGPLSPVSPERSRDAPCMTALLTLPIVTVTDHCSEMPSAWSSTSTVKAGKNCFLRLFLSHTLSCIAPNTWPHTASQYTTDLLLQVRVKISLRETIPGQCHHAPGVTGPRSGNLQGQGSQSNLTAQVHKQACSRTACPRVECSQIGEIICWLNGGDL